MDISLNLRSLRKSIAGLSMLALLATMSFAGIAKAQTFSDVSSSDWYYTYVEDLVDQGVLGGYEDGTFGAGDNLTREQAAKVMVLAYVGEDELDYDYDAEFSDVEEDAWYAVYVNTAAKLGIVSGYDDSDAFGVGDYITRAAFAKMVVNSAGLAEDTTDAPHFSDVEDGTWYYEYVETAYNNSVIDGYSDGTFMPGNNVNRAEASKMVYNGQNPELRYEDTEEEEEETEEETEEEEEEEEEEPESLATLTVEMGDEIEGATVPKGATSVDMLSLSFTAEGDDAEVDGITVHRTGVGSYSDFDYVYVYQDGVRLTTGKTIASDDNEATFGSLNIAVADGETVEVTIVADMSSSATAGDENALEVLSADKIETNAAEVSGTFAITGETFTMSGSSAGTVTIAKNGSVPNPTIGETEAEIAEFQLTAASEDQAFQRIALTVKGTISNEAFSNLYLTQGGDTIATAESVSTDDDLVVFEVEGTWDCDDYGYTDDGFCIGKGNSKTFNIYADIGAEADPSDTIIVYLDESTDLESEGLVYGYGAAVTYTSYDNSAGDYSDSSQSTVQGGQMTISQDGPSSQDIAVNGKDVILSTMTFTSERNVEVKQLQGKFTASSSGLIASDDSVAYFTDFKLVELDEDGEITETLMGPQELTLSGNSDFQTLTFTNSWTMSEGESKTVAWTCDVGNYSTNLDGITIEAELVAISTSAGIRDTDTSEYITDIVPSTAVTGNTHTVRAASLAVALASTPTSDTYVKGTSGVNLATFTLAAGSAMDITISQIDLSGYVDNNDGTYVKGYDSADGAGALYLRNVITNVWLEDSEGNVIGSTESFSTAGEASFTSLDWEIESGETELMYVYGNISSSAPFNSNNDMVSVDLLTGDVVCEDEEGNTVTPTGLGETEGPNNGATPGVKMTVSSAGTITFAEDTTDQLQDQIVAAEATEVLVGRYTVTSTDEDWEVTKLTFTASGTVGATTVTTATQMVDNISSLKIVYPTDLDDPDTLDGSKTVSMSGTNVKFTSLGMMVPKDEQITFELYANLAGHNLEAAAGDADSDDGLRMVLNTGDVDGEANGDLEAVGQGSSTTKTESDKADIIATNYTYVYRTVPTVSNDTSLSSSLILGANQEVYRFEVEAGTTNKLALRYLTLDVSQSGLATGATANSLGNAVATDALYDVECVGTASSATAPVYVTETSDPGTVIGTGCYDAANSVFRIDMNVSTSTGEQVKAGSTKTFSVWADVYKDSDSNTTDETLSIKINQDTSHNAAATVENLIGNNAARTSAQSTGMIWSDLGLSQNDPSVSSAEWMNGYKVEGMPVSYMTLS